MPKHVSKQWISLALIGLSLFSVIGLGISVTAIVLVSGTTTQTCQVQATGLRATPHLVKTLGDLGNILTYSLSVDTTAQKKAIPSTELRQLEDLAYQASTYAHIENQQPSSRSC